MIFKRSISENLEKLNRPVGHALQPRHTFSIVHIYGTWYNSVPCMHTGYNAVCILGTTQYPASTGYNFAQPRPSFSKVLYMVIIFFFSLLVTSPGKGTRVLGL